MRRAEEERILFSLPPISAPGHHLHPWRRGVDVPRPGTRMTPIPKVNAFQDSPSFVTMSWPIHRRGKPDPNLTYPISGHPHHWFRMRAEWQEERFCAMIKLLLPFHCPIPVWSIDSFCSTELYAQNADDFAGRNSPSEDQLTATGILYT